MMRNNKTFGQAGEIAAILQIVGTAVNIAVKSGWFYQTEWCEDIARAFTQLKATTGRAYPDLEAMGKDVARSFRTYQNAWPWDKQRTGEEYQKKVVAWGRAIEAAAKAYEEEQKPVEAKIEVPTIWLLLGLGLLVIGMKEK